MHKSLSKEDRNMTTYGYARVSTNGQDLGSQEVELMAAGCAKVFKEKVSGAKTDRAERCVGRGKARQAGTLDTRPAQCAGHYRRAGGWLPQSQGHLGRYNYAAW